MENLDKIREQPFEVDKTQEELKNILDNGGEAQPSNGSQLGKFNSPESLLEAYNNLQREFTKKCQKLSELEKQQTDNVKLETSQDETKNKAPVYENLNWRSKVADFLSSNEYARKFSKEISAEIINDQNLQSSENMLEIAWSRVLAKNFKTPEQIASDNNFMQNFVLGNEEVKKQVFNSYVSELNSVNVPNLIGAGFKGGKNMITKSNKPTSLKDANQIVLNLFSK